MRLRWYLVDGVHWRRARRALLLVLLALLTVVSVPALSKERVTGTNKEPVTYHSSQISQPTKASQLSSQGEKLYEAGQFSEAASIWQQAASAYERAGNKDGVAQSQINVAEALQALGHYPQACNTLLQAFSVVGLDCRQLTQSNSDRQQRWDALLKTLEGQPNSLNKTIGLRSLGDVLQKLDALELSSKILQLSLNVARGWPSPENESAVLLSMGNTEQAWGNRAQAREDSTNEPTPTPWRCMYRPSMGASKKFYQQAALLYQQAASTSVSPSIWIKAQLNRLSVLLKTGALSKVRDVWPQIQSKLKDLPPSRTAVYAQIELAQSLTCLKQASAVDAPSWKEIAQTFATAAKQTRSLNDQKAESYALGYLGRVYAQTQKQPGAQDLSYAQDLTRQALILAQSNNATEIIYLWQWQLGYLMKIQGDITGALSAYTEAVSTLQALRSDLAATSTNVQFSFQESVEPVYRQMVDLLLQSKQPNQANLKQARDMIEALQIAELENLLRCNLQAASPVPIDLEADPTAAVIYPIILPDRIEVILSLSGQPLRHYSKPLPKEQNLEDSLQMLRQSLLTPNSTGPSFLKLSQQVYNLLIEPVETELEKSGVKTLVFVLDGPLSQIPMAALYDGKQFLIEKYAVPISPSIQLLPSQPVAGRQLEVLAAGISQKIPGFSAPALPEVKDELEQISKISRTVLLRDREFTSRALQTQINERPFSVVHLATHGQFSSQPDQTYIQAWDGSITPNQLKLLLQSREQNRPKPIDLLVLSACDTASGDRRAALGLAGVAVRAGARSTLASLWQVNDNSTAELMTSFYKSFSNPTDSRVAKAKALQSAQLDLLHRYKSPFYWAGYVLVGDWN